MASWLFDYFGGSHNIWHATVLGGILFHYCAMQDLFAGAFVRAQGECPSLTQWKHYFFFDNSGWRAPHWTMKQMINETSVILGIMDMWLNGKMGWHTMISEVGWQRPGDPSFPNRCCSFHGVEFTDFERAWPASLSAKPASFVLGDVIRIDNSEGFYNMFLLHM